MAYAGPAEEGQRALAPFRALAAPIADLTRPMSYGELYMPDELDYHPAVSGYSLFLDAVDRGAAEIIVERLRAAPTSFAAAQLRVLGGAMARVPVAATAFAHRGRRIMATLIAYYERPEQRTETDAWVADFAEVLRQGETGVYVNFLGDEGEARVRDAYPGATWDRLAAIKARYDPTNLFRLNQNIPPVAG
jgi:FAD/FMN-containing dehydrogenase